MGIKRSSLSVKKYGCPKLNSMSKAKGKLISLVFMFFLTIKTASMTVSFLKDTINLQLPFLKKLVSSLKESTDFDTK